MANVVTFQDLIARFPEIEKTERRAWNAWRIAEGQTEEQFPFDEYLESTTYYISEGSAYRQTDFGDVRRWTGKGWGRKLSWEAYDNL